MSVKEAKSQFGQTLFFLYEGIPVEFLDAIDVGNCFLPQEFYISQSQHQIVRVSKGSNKKSFTFKLFKFCKLKHSSF